MNATTKQKKKVPFENALTTNYLIIWSLPPLAKLSVLIVPFLQDIIRCVGHMWEYTILSAMTKFILEKSKYD